MTQGCIVCGAFVGHADACPAYIEDLKQERYALKAALEEVRNLTRQLMEAVPERTGPAYHAYLRLHIIARQALNELEGK